MANLKEQEKWEDGIYQIEENDPVLGGENGITNKPAKQLANRTTWLKKALELLTGKSKPKDLTADSASEADKGGHSHALPKSSTSQQGIVQLDSATNSTSESKAATPKAIKTLKDLIDAITRNFGNYIPNSKKSNAVNSPSSETIATSAAAKTAYDKGVEAKNAADNAQRTADEAVRFNRNYFAGDLNTLNDKHEICYLEQAQTKNRNFPSDAYQWGILHVYSNGSLGSQVYYADNGELWARTRWHNHDWNEWKRFDGLNIPTEIAKVKSIADSNTRNFANYINNSKKSNEVDSTSTDTVASSRAVKLAYDRGTTALNAANGAQRTADSANSNANERVPKNGDSTIVGSVLAQHPNINNGSWSNWKLATKNGVWSWEVNPNSHTEDNRRFNMKYSEGEKNYYLAFPHVDDNGDTVAYRSWVGEQIKNKVNAEDYSRGTGWRKSPDGFLHQWLQLDSGSDSYRRYTFPRAFSQQCFAVFVCDFVSQSHFSPRGIAVGAWDKTGFYLKSERDTASVVVFAIGI